MEQGGLVSCVLLQIRFAY